MMKTLGELLNDLKFEEVQNTFYEEEDDYRTWGQELVLDTEIRNEIIEYLSESELGIDIDSLSDSELYDIYNNLGGDSDE